MLLIAKPELTLSLKFANNQRVCFKLGDILIYDLNKSQLFQNWKLEYLCLCCYAQKFINKQRTLST